MAKRPSPIEESEAVHTPKYTELETDEAHQGRPAKSMQCSLPPHNTLTFANYSEYESHYQKEHTNRCRDCQKNFPSEHFLDLHLTENHDPIVATKRDQGEKTYACFVEGCDKVCIDWKKRRSHLVDKHGFPKNYDFFIVGNGIDGRRSMLRAGVDRDGHRKSSRERGRRDSSATTATHTTEATSVSLGGDSVAEVSEEVKEGTVQDSKPAQSKSKEASVDDVAKSMSSLQFVPRSVTFGKRKAKSGFAKS